MDTLPLVGLMGIAHASRVQDAVSKPLAYTGPDTKEAALAFFTNRDFALPVAAMVFAKRRLDAGVKATARFVMSV